MSEDELSQEAKGEEASQRLMEGLKCCRSMVTDYRELIGGAGLQASPDATSGVADTSPAVD